MAEHEHTHQGHNLWPLLTLVSVGALIAAPYVLPALGIGTTAAATAATDAFHAHNIAEGTGVAGFLAGGISHIPLVGASLAAGGWATVAASSVIGLGGILLSNWLKNREHEGDFPWSKIIRYTALGTSMLISLPSLLTGIAISTTFLANFLIDDPATMHTLISGLSSTLGSASMEHMASSGGIFATLLPHLLSCGFPLITAGAAFSLSGKQQPETKLAQPPEHQGTLSHPLHLPPLPQFAR